MTFARFILVILLGCSTPPLTLRQPSRLCLYTCGHSLQVNSAGVFHRDLHNRASLLIPSKYHYSHRCHCKRSETTRKWSKKSILPILDIIPIPTCKTYTTWSPHKLTHSGKLGTESLTSRSARYLKSLECPLELTFTESSHVLEEVCYTAEAPDY